MTDSKMWYAPQFNRPEMGLAFPGGPISAGESVILLDLSGPAALQFLRQRQAQAEAGYGRVNGW